MGKNVHSFSDETFETEVLKEAVPVLVDFWAEWCGPCRALAPTVDGIADAYAGKVKVGKLNVDDSPETAARYGIRSIPTLLVFKNGQVAAQQVGAVPRPALERMLQNVLVG